MSRSAQRLITVFIIAFWLVMMGLLIQREIARRSGDAPLVGQARFDEAFDTWMGIYVGAGERIGTVNVRGLPEARDAEPGLRYIVKARIATTVLSSETNFDLSANTWVGMERGPEEFDLTLASGPHETRAFGRIENGRVEGTLETGGESLPLNLPLPAGFLSQGSGLPGMSMPPLRPGESMEVDAFDPITLQPRKAVLRCIKEETREIAGEQVKALVIETELGSLSSRAWVSETGEVLRAETPFGFAIERISPAEGWEEMPHNSAELLTEFNVSVSGAVPFRGAALMRVRVTGADVSLVPESEYQHLEDDVLVISTPSVSGVEEETGDFSSYLVSDAFVTADHPRIQALSEEICGDADEPWEQARRIYTWVYENLEKDPAITVPVALEVLNTRHGDCNEHAVLFTALARAAGIPTRIAVGLVWSDELEAFAYHAWAEVRAGGQWIPMDPTLGQEIADATHIKLVEGGIGEWVKLLPFMNQIGLEVIEVR